MSGFEIVGVVLGVLPLVIEAAKSAESHVKGIKALWMFRRHFKEFVHAITFEEIFFCQNLDLLLAPLEISDMERRCLRDSPTSTLWHHPDIVDKIRQHLKEALPLCTQILRELNDSLNNLYETLPIKGGKVSLPPPHTVASEMLRLCISFSQNKKAALDSIKKTNKQLERILRNANDIGLMTRARSTSSRLVDASLFIKLQKRSQALYRALKSGFRCSCNDQHRCGLSARWEKSKLLSQGPTLNLLIDDHQGRKQVRWEVEAADRSAPSTKQHGVDQMHELDRKAEFQEQRKGYVKAAQDSRPAVLALSALAAVTNPSNTKTENLWTNSRRKLKKPVKAVKSALRASAVASSSQIQVAQLQMTPSFEKHVQIAAPPAPTRAISHVTTICGLIKVAPQGDKYLGTIKAGHHDIGFYLEPLSQRRLLGAQNETMETFWTSTKDLCARLQVGLCMAVTLLCLGTSAWTPRDWTWEDVFLMRCSNDYDGRSVTFGPYFNHDSLSITLQEDATSAESHAETALFALGVFLLELHYREPLEHSPYWDLHCPGGRQDEVTAKAAAHDWYEELALDPALEEGLAEPIRRCIGIKFSTPADLSSSEFLRDVLETVVQPLEEYIDKLSGGIGDE